MTTSSYDGVLLYLKQSQYYTRHSPLKTKKMLVWYISQLFLLLDHQKWHYLKVLQCFNVVLPGPREGLIQELKAGGGGGVCSYPLKLPYFEAYFNCFCFIITYINTIIK